MVWRDLFLASRQAILGYKGPRYWRAGEQPLGFPCALCLGEIWPKQEKRAQYPCGAAGSGGGRQENGNNL